LFDEPLCIGLRHRTRLARRFSFTMLRMCNTLSQYTNVTLDSPWGLIIDIRLRLIQELLSVVGDNTGAPFRLHTIYRNVVCAVFRYRFDSSCLRFQHYMYSS